jgi:hypothetical protein
MIQDMSDQSAPESAETDFHLQFTLPLYGQP